MSEMQRLLDDWYVTMDQFIGEFSETFAGGIRHAGGWLRAATARPVPVGDRST